MVLIDFSYDDIDNEDDDNSWFVPLSFLLI